MTDIQLRVLLKREEFQLDVDLRLPAKGVTVFYGHSGSGKTTLLRCIAGLEQADQADIRFKDAIWQDNKSDIPTHKRQLGYVFQEASLFEHLSAEKNLVFAQKRAKGKAKFNREQIVELLGIGHLLKRYPAQLSGGERQRVAIARALLTNPQLLLMDEPLASLDYARKQEILPYLETLKHELELPILYVTHSPDEVARLADHLVAMQSGKVLTSGTLTETMSRLDFPIKLGEEAGVVLEAKITDKDQQWHLTKIALNGGELWFRDHGHAIGESIRLRILARDVSLALAPQSDSSITNLLPSEVIALENDEHPGQILVKLSVGEDILISRVSSRSADKLNIHPGQKIWAQIKSVAVVR